MALYGVLDVASLSDIGLLRKHNEDALDCDASNGIMVLADGMGGHLAGEVASEIAVLSIVADLKYALQKSNSQPFSLNHYRYTENQNIAAAIARANSLIYNIAQTQPDFSGMGTTLVLGLFANNKLWVAHVGDSRMYRLRQQQLLQITEDHSIIQEQINAGWITTQQAKYSIDRNLVTRALGVEAEVELTLNEFNVEVGDIYLLCSDGLTDLVEDTAIQATLNQEMPMSVLAEKLIAMANERGGIDNTSVILVQVNQGFAYRKTLSDYARDWIKRLNISLH